MNPRGALLPGTGFGPGLPAGRASGLWPLVARVPRASGRSRRDFVTSLHPPRRTVLVVDDEPCIQELFRFILTRFLRLRVLTTGDSLEALRLLAASRVDLVTSDLARPRMGGMEFLHRVQRFHPGLRVLIASGCFSDSRAGEVQAAGAWVALAKPFHWRVLFRLVRRALQHRPRGHAVAEPCPPGARSSCRPRSRGR